MSRFLLHGLVIETDFAVAAQQTEREPDLVCTYELDPWSSAPTGGTELARSTSDGEVTMRVLAQHGAHVVEWPGFMRARVQPEGAVSRVTFSVADLANEALVPVLLSPAVGAMAMLRGALVLHATAVIVDGKAVLLLADRGGGKSSIAALLCSAGAALLAEDVCALVIVDGMPMAYAGVQELRLRTTSPWLADLQGLQRSVDHLDGRAVVAPSRSTMPVVPLGAVLVVGLDRSVDTAVVLPLAAIQFVHALMAAQRCPASLTSSVIRSAFGTAGSCADSVPAGVLTVPWAAEYRHRPLGREIKTLLETVVRR